MSRIVVTVIGAGGKMGTRTSENLQKQKERVELLLVESGDKGRQAVEARGLTLTEQDLATQRADVVVLAVPDTQIQQVSSQLVPKMRRGAALMILDPAAALAQELMMREDCTFAVAHPCHPSYFLDQDSYEARHDYFGGGAGKQDIVMAKIAGEQERFAVCRTVAEWMFAPVLHSYVMGLRDMAFLEPTLVELLGATCLHAMAETVDQAEQRGIERAAAISFLTGHVYNLTANFLGLLGDTPVSDACQVAIGLGERLVLREDWRRIWQDDVLDRVIATMLHPDRPRI